jgi:tetratricopeptide (TPR) repeat protein
MTHRRLATALLLAAFASLATPAIAQQPLPWDTPERAKPKAPQASAPAPASPSRGAPTQQAVPGASPPGTTLVEATFKGRHVEARLVPATNTATITLDGVSIATVKNIGKLGKIDVMSGAKFSLFKVFVDTAKSDCSSYVLVAVPMVEGIGKAEAKSGFGACSSKLLATTMRRGTWESWHIVAYREDRPKVQIAVMSADNLIVRDVPAKPCLFSTESNVRSTCIRDMVAQAAQAPEGGLETGDELAGGHRLVSYLNAEKNRGALILDSKPLQSLADTAVLHVERAVDVGRGALFTFWRQPTGTECGYHAALIIDKDARTPEPEQKFGFCKNHIASMQRRGGNINDWLAIATKAGEPSADIARFRDGKITIATVKIDPCYVTGQPLVDQCLERFVPGFSANTSSPATGSASTGSQAPGQSQASDRFARLKQAFAHLAANDIDRGLADFDRLIVETPNWSFAYAGRGYGLALKGQTDQAMPDIEKAIQLEPRSAPAYMWRGMIFSMRNEHERALAALDQALSLDPKLSDAYAYRGGVFVAKGEHDRAREDLNKALELLPNSVVALSWRAAMWTAKKEHEQAVADLSQVLAQRPKVLGFYARRAAAYEALGHKDKAIADYIAAGALQPSGLADILAQANARARLKILGDPTTGAPPCNKAKGEACL